MVKEGAAVIDVGINRIQDPKTGKIRLIGDVDFEGKNNLSVALVLLTTVKICYFNTDLCSLGLTKYFFLTWCRSEGEGGIHHSCSWRCGSDDCRHADEEHCDRCQKRTDALKAHCEAIGVIE